MLVVEDEYYIASETARALQGAGAEVAGPCASEHAARTELESRRGVLTGRYLGGDCTGAEKARRVRARYDLGRYPIIYAYGDTHEDRELLDLASKRYFRWREVDAT